MEFSMDFSDIEEFGKFINLWGRKIELNVKSNMVKQYEALGNEIAAYIYSQIQPALNSGGSNYGDFMAARTLITVTANQYGFDMSISGIPESDLPAGERKNASPGKDNLWAAQEFGRYVSASSGTQNIKKDVASISNVRKSRKGFDLKGRQGAIQSLIGVLGPDIEALVADFLKRAAEGQILLAGEEATRASEAKDIRGYSGFSRQLESVGLSKQTLVGEGITEVFPAHGTSTLQGRAASGQFASLGQHIKVQL